MRLSWQLHKATATTQLSGGAGTEVRIPAHSEKSIKTAVLKVPVLVPCTPMRANRRVPLSSSGVIHACRERKVGRDNLPYQTDERKFGSYQATPHLSSFISFCRRVIENKKGAPRGNIECYQNTTEASQTTTSPLLQYFQNSYILQTYNHDGVTTSRPTTTSPAAVR